MQPPYAYELVSSLTEQLARTRSNLHRLTCLDNAMLVQAEEVPARNPHLPPLQFRQPIPSEPSGPRALRVEWQTRHPDKTTPVGSG